LVIWGAGIVAFCGLYALHAYRVRDMLSHSQVAATFLRGGIAFAFDAFRWASVYAGGPGTFLILALLAIAGASLVESRWERIMVLACAIAPVAGFLVVGNGATMNLTGESANYWAPIVVPLLIALAPWSAAGAVRLVAPARTRL
jgi:hypothetical protein